MKKIKGLITISLLVGILTLVFSPLCMASTMENPIDRGYSAGSPNYNTEPTYKGTDRNGRTWEEQQQMKKDGIDMGNLPVLDIGAIFRMGNYSWQFPVYQPRGGGNGDGQQWVYYYTPGEGGQIPNVQPYEGGGSGNVWQNLWNAFLDLVRGVLRGFDNPYAYLA